MLKSNSRRLITKFTGNKDVSFISFEKTCTEFWLIVLTIV